MQETEGRERWAGYYDATEGRPPRPTCLRALAGLGLPAADAPPALDLGCGTGRDALAILDHGWRLLAVDAEAVALERLAARLTPDLLARVERRQADLAGFEPPSTRLVNASFVLPFLPPAAFASLWERIMRCLVPGGRLAGQLFGPRDSWCLSGRCFGLALAELPPLLEGCRVDLLQEEEEDGVTPRGEAKHWHIWHLVLERR